MGMVYEVTRAMPRGRRFGLGKIRSFGLPDDPFRLDNQGTTVYAFCLLDVNIPMLMHGCVFMFKYRSLRLDRRPLLRHLLLLRHVDPNLFTHQPQEHTKLHTQVHTSTHKITQE